MPNAVISCESLAKKYPDGTAALRGVSLEIGQGEIAAVIGPSGAGKSTLLRCVNGLVIATSGRVETLGIDISRDRRSLRKLRRQVGMVFQSFNLIPRLSVLQNVLLGRLGYKSLLSSLALHFYESEKLVGLKALDRVGLLEQASKPASQLSGGQMQRVAIARALTQDPPVILADEPVSNLDPVIAKNVLLHLVQICRDDGRTVLLNLHAVEMVRLVAERVIGVRDGLVVYDGGIDGLTTDVLKSIYGEEYTD